MRRAGEESWREGEIRHREQCSPHASEDEEVNLGFGRWMCLRVEPRCNIGTQGEDDYRKKRLRDSEGEHEVECHDVLYCAMAKVR